MQEIIEPSPELKKEMEDYVNSFQLPKDFEWSSPAVSRPAWEGAKRQSVVAYIRHSSWLVVGFSVAYCFETPEEMKEVIRQAIKGSISSLTEAFHDKALMARLKKEHEERQMVGR